MAVTSNRQVRVLLTGDIEYDQSFNATASTTSPGQLEVMTLAEGDNVISIPEGSVGVTIIPPSDNDEPITLKGDAGDIGIELHPTDPTILGLTTTTGFVLAVAADVSNVRFIWT